MGASLSFCGLGPASNDGGMRPGYDRHEFTKDLKRTPSQRLRAASSATDTSIASILSASDQLIPEAFRPVDIQVISQRRQRRPSRGASSSQATLSASALYSRGAGDVVPLSSYSGSHLLALQQSKHARGDDGEPLGGARDLVRGCA